ncbi:ATP-binding cassette domain-containing protein (plasmid) [Roseomonas marmotae]|uniref:ATP-binding cassette domain-containing protein n=1 Tax=Roseomonas marmotae TaxID=2768161 RepID=A0ABS3KFG4_9PROT|nr:ATP-binding cassette domain-containing protein [Roseomonas marmotae]QTI82035.1 ATP-binding cassette domain-containing protein [Roseomonas marmotae]
MEGLSLAAGATVLVRDVSLSLERGRVMGLLGSSGGGKSLTVLAMLGLLPPGVRQTAGQVRHAGRLLDDAGRAALRGRVAGLVQQSPRACFNPIVTIGRHFAETLAADGVSRREACGRAAALLAEVGFDDPSPLLAAYPFQLSGGMLQRVMVALALAREPDFLLADEPTTDLDLVVQASILALLERLMARRGLGILLVTHDLSVLARLADRVAVMQGGRIVERQPVADFFAAPRHPASRALMRRHLELYGEALP